MSLTLTLDRPNVFTVRLEFFVQCMCFCWDNIWWAAAGDYRRGAGRGTSGVGCFLDCTGAMGLYRGLGTNFGGP